LGTVYCPHIRTNAPLRRGGNAYPPPITRGGIRRHLDKDGSAFSVDATVPTPQSF